MRVWADFDADDNTGRYIIGTDDGNAVLCTCAGEGPADKKLAEHWLGLKTALELIAGSAGFAGGTSVKELQRIARLALHLLEPL